MPTIYAQRYPAGVASVTDLKDGVEELPIGSLSEVIDRIRSIIPFADFSEEYRINLTVDKMWLCIELEGDDLIELATFETSEDGVMLAAAAAIMKTLGLIGQLESGDDFNPIKNVRPADAARWNSMRDELIK